MEYIQVLDDMLIDTEANHLIDCDLDVLAAEVDHKHDDFVDPTIITTTPPPIIEEATYNNSDNTSLYSSWWQHGCQIFSGYKKHMYSMGPSFAVLSLYHQQSYLWIASGYLFSHTLGITHALIEGFHKASKGMDVIHPEIEPRYYEANLTLEYMQQFSLFGTFLGLICDAFTLSNNLPMLHYTPLGALWGSGLGAVAGCIYFMKPGNR